jgi:hypothetical protein
MGRGRRGEESYGQIWRRRTRGEQEPAAATLLLKRWCLVGPARAKSGHEGAVARSEEGPGRRQIQGGARARLARTSPMANKVGGGWEEEGGAGVDLNLV